MIALPKLLLLALLAIAAWYAMRWFNRTGSRIVQRRPETAPRSRSAIEAEDLTACRICGAYVIAGAGHCGRADCPRPR